MSRGSVRFGVRVAATLLVAAMAVGCLPPPQARTPGSNTAPGAAATAKPSPTPRAFIAAIAAFTERVASGKLTYRVAFKGTVRASSDTLPIAGTMEVSGADFASTFTYDMSRDYDLGKIRVQVRGVKGKGYIKSGAAAWRTIKGFGVGYSYVPFKAVAAPADVRYLGAVKVGDKTFHKVAVTGALLIHPNTIPGMSQKEEVDNTVLEVAIDDAGRPRSGTWKLWGKSRVGVGSGQLQRVVYELNLTFTKVGSKITIKRP
jgi:hypothetical protein